MYYFTAGSTCQFDSVSVYEGNVNGTRLGKFCGLTAPGPVATRGTMFIQFKTDQSIADDGFKATFVKSGNYYLVYILEFMPFIPSLT